MLAAFLERYPGAIDTVATDSLLDIAEEKIDIAFRIGGVAGNDFIARTLHVDTNIFVASAGYVARSKVEFELRSGGLLNVLPDYTGDPLELSVIYMPERVRPANARRAAGSRARRAQCRTCRAGRLAAAVGYPEKH